MRSNGLSLPVAYMAATRLIENKEVNGTIAQQSAINIYPINTLHTVMMYAVRSCACKNLVLMYKCIYFSRFARHLTMKNRK